MSRVSVRRRVEVVDTRAGTRAARPDTLAGEEPLEIRTGGAPLTVTMRTPGHDVELVHGFLLGEGVITTREDVLEARYCAGSVVDGASGLPENTYNLLEVDLAPAAAERAQGARRNFGTTSSCGVCGSASIDEVRLRMPRDLRGRGPRVPVEIVAGLPDRLREEQKVFQRTGGLHASGLYRVSTGTLTVREDVGRHNAADKVLGAALLEGRLPADDDVLVLSGRVSYDLVQKAAMAGVTVIAAVSAPSSLAAQMSEELGITLCGFVRGGRLNVYTHGSRLV